MVTKVYNIKMLFVCLLVALFSCTLVKDLKWEALKVGITSPGKGEEVATNFTVSGTLGGDTKGFSVKIMVSGVSNGVEASRNAIVEGKTFRAVFNVPLLGDYDLVAEASDAYGDTASTGPIRFRVDNFPILEFVSPVSSGGIIYTNAHSAFIMGTASILSGAEITNVNVTVSNGFWISNLQAIGTTNWSNTVFLAEGSNRIVARAFADNGKLSQDRYINGVVEHIIFVSTTGNDSAAGTRACPIKTIQLGVTRAATNGWPIYVAQGLYTPGNGLNASISGVTITNNNISLIGGWESNFSERIGNSLLYGNNLLSNIVYISNISNVIMDGFHISGGKGGFGSGVNILSSGWIIITNCSIYSNSGTQRGGGIYLRLSSNVILSGFIYGNSADYGGGIALWYSGNNRLIGFVYGNSAIYTGGGINVYSSSCNTIDGAVYDNSAIECGGGIYFCVSYSNTINATIYGNSTTSYGGGGLASASFSYNTITGSIYSNSASTYGGGVLFYDSSSYNTINCFIYGNSATYGGGVCLFGTSYNTMNGSIYGNNATNGGGIYLYSSDYFTNNGYITNNRANITGGGVYTNVSAPNSRLENVMNNIPNNFN